MNQDIDSSNPNNQDEAERLFQMGMKFNSNGPERNYQEAWKCLRKAAEAGHASAQKALGDMYEEVAGNEANAAEALKWYTRAAEQGNADAMWELGMKCAEGRGVELDVPEAEKWFRQALEQYRVAAEGGDPSAMQRLADAYQDGIVVEQNISEAEKWKQKAIENSKTNFNLDEQNSSGNDKESVENRYRKALEQGDDRALDEFVHWVIRETVEGSSVEECERKAEETALEWYQKAAEMGNPHAMEALVYRLLHLKRNANEAWHWYRRAVEKYQSAAEQGDPAAMYAIGRIVCDYENIHASYCKFSYETEHWYRAAADIGYVPAIEKLSLIGVEGVRKDIRTTCCLKLAKLGYVSRMEDCGDIFSHEKGETNHAMANEWYLKAITYRRTHLESPLCVALKLVSPGITCSAIGDCYAGMDKKEEATKWYLKAAEQGYSYALKRLKELNKPSWMKWLGL